MNKVYNAVCVEGVGMTTKYMMDLFNIVCNTEERKQDFFDKYYRGDKNWLISDVLQYRHDQIDTGRGQELDGTSIKNNYEEYFVMPLPKTFYHYIDRKGLDGVLNLINFHKENPYSNPMQFVGCDW